MAFVKPQFKPGIVKDDSALIASQTYVSADKLRFRMGQPETIGGWETANLSTNMFTGICRGAHSWAAASGDRVRAFGTESKLYSFFGGAIEDITPYKYKGTLVDPFTTTNGSSTVIVAILDHGLKVDDTITFALADAVGGLTVDGDYTVSAIRSLDAIEIDAGSNASSDATGGGTVEITAALDTGLTDGIAGTGFGTGTYGTGYYGVPTGGDVDPRTWSVDNWGNNLYVIPSKGAVYEWQPSGTYNELVTSGDFAAATGWTSGTGWSIAAGVATATAGTASDLKQDLTALISGGLTYELTVDVVCSAGTVQLVVTSADTGDTNFGQAFDKSGTYTRRFRAPSNPTFIKFHKDATFAGSLDNVSVKLCSVAYRIQSAPEYNIGGFVDPSRIAVTYGTVQYNGTYNGMCVRWSDQEDNTDWVPTDTNLSGEFVLAQGSRIVGAIVTRGQNLIFTDSAAYTMRFTGDTGSVFSFDLIGTGCGLAGKNAVAENNGWVFWWGRNNQFYLFRGGEPQIIDCPIRRDVTDNLAPSQNEKIFCGVNSKFNEVWWFYPDSRDGNECSRVVVYNWVEDHWTSHTFNRTSWIPTGIDPYPIAFGTDGNIYYHEKGTTANGASMTFSLQTGFMQIPEAGGNLLTITKYFPDFDAISGSLNLSIAYRMFPNSDEMTYGPISISSSDTEKNFRLPACREAAFSWASGTNNGFIRWGQLSFDITATGMKR